MQDAEQELTDAQRDALDALEVYQADKSLSNLEALGQAIGHLRADVYGPSESDLRAIEAAGQ